MAISYNPITLQTLQPEPQPPGIASLPQAQAAPTQVQAMAQKAIPPAPTQPIPLPKMIDLAQTQGTQQPQAQTPPPAGGQGIMALPGAQQTIANPAVSQAVADQAVSAQKQVAPGAASPAPVDYKAQLRELAVSNPNAPVFQQNPDLLNIYKPITKLQSGTVGQYGYAYGVPILSATAADKLLGEDKVLGAARELQHGQGVAKELGADPNSKYAGRLATGAGIFGITGKTQDFKRYGDVDKRIEQSGGIQTEVDKETGEETRGIYETYKNREGEEERRFTPISKLFETAERPSEGTYQSTAEDEYLKYQANKKSLLAGAKTLGIDPSKYPDLNSLYDAVNNDPKVKDVYMWQGRTAGWDPKMAAALGVQTTDINQRGVVNHAQVLYRREGDKLVPILDPKTGKPLATAFKFDDPNTSRGFVGDLLGNIGKILSLPPIAMAFGAAGGLQGLLTGNLGVGAGFGAASPQFASAMASSWLNPSAVGSFLNPGNLLGKAGESVLGQAAINTGLGALSAAMGGGNLSQSLKAGLASGVGTGVTGATNLALGDAAKSGLGQLAANIAGGAAGTAVSGGSVENYLRNQAIGQGLGALMGATGNAANEIFGPKTTQVLQTLMPMVNSRRLTPMQAVQLAMAIGKTTGATPPPKG